MARRNPDEDIEVRIYPGADAAFTLYGCGNSYAYERGEGATIALKWDDAQQTLTIGERQGSFPGMLEQRRFHLVLVKEGHGIGLPACENANHVVTYDGSAQSISI